MLIETKLNMSKENLQIYYTSKRICAYFNQQQITSLLLLLDEHLLKSYNWYHLVDFLVRLHGEFPFLESVGFERFRLYGSNGSSHSDFTMRFQLDHKQTIRRLHFQFDDLLTRKRLTEQLPFVFQKKQLQD